MATANGIGDRAWIDPLALGLVAMGASAIIAISVLSILRIQVPGSLDSVIYTTCGAIAGAYGANRKPNGNGNGNGNGRGLALDPAPSPASVK